MNTREPDPAHLARLARQRMPFGKYRDRFLCELPDAYLLWFERKGWPSGQLGQDLQEILEIHRAGCIALLRKIASSPQG